MEVFFLGGRQTGTRGGTMLTPNELVFTFGGSYVCDADSQVLRLRLRPIKVSTR